MSTSRAKRGAAAINPMTVKQIQTALANEKPDSTVEVNFQGWIYQIMDVVGEEQNQEPIVTLMLKQNIRG